MTMRRMAAVLALVLLGTTAASAQILDNTWFRLKGSSKGTALTSSGGVSSDKIKFQAFMFLEFLEPEEGIVTDDEEYGYTIFSENDSGQFIAVSGGIVDFIRDGNRGFMLGTITLGGQNEGLEGFDLAISVSPLLADVRLRTTSENSLKRATLKTNAGILQAIPITEGLDEVFLGSPRLRGKTVPESKLPFVPVFP